MGKMCSHITPSIFLLLIDTLAQHGHAGIYFKSSGRIETYFDSTSAINMEMNEFTVNDRTDGIISYGELIVIIQIIEYG